MTLDKYNNSGSGSREIYHNSSNNNDDAEGNGYNNNYVNIWSALVEGSRIPCPPLVKQLKMLQSV